MRSKLIGRIGADAGLCWIGDPCYVLPDDASQNPGADKNTGLSQDIHCPTPSSSIFKFKSSIS
jgi:hypothetical protein